MLKPTQPSKRVSSTQSKVSDMEDGSAALNSYRSTISPRNLIIQRGNYNSENVTTMQRRMSGLQGSLLTASMTSLSLLSSSGMNTVKQCSDKGKRDMQDLNERLACYIEKVRFLEAQNNKLIEELTRLKTKWGKETSQVKEMYQAEVDTARRLLDEAAREKARLEIKVASVQEGSQEVSMRLDESNKQLLLLKELVEKQNKQLSDYEAEAAAMRRRFDGFEVDKQNDKKIIAELQGSLNSARNDLDQETLWHIDAEYRRQSLEEELLFLKEIHAQEMKELAALAYRDSTAENREYWRSEMGEALRDIQNLYDEKLASMKAEIEIFYGRKLQDLKTGSSRQAMEATHCREENKRLQHQISELKDRYNHHEAKTSHLARDLEVSKRDAEGRERELARENEDLKGEVVRSKAELESMLFELQSIVDAKLGLELEIAAYRKLLEVEEGRGSLRSVVDGSDDGENVFSSSVLPSFYSNSFSTAASVADHPTEVRLPQLVKGEMTAKTSYQKSAKGSVSVAECASDGSYIVVDNTSRKMENLAGWKVLRLLQNNKKVEFVFPDGASLQAASSLKIWAKGALTEGAETKGALVCGEETWGVGDNITTKLFNASGEEVACHVKKTSYI